MKKVYYGIVFALAITALASGSVYSQLTQAKAGDASLLKNNSSTVQIELKNPISPDALFAAENNTAFDEMIIESDFTVNKEAVHDFYVVNPKNKDKNIKEDYIKNRKAFLADLKSANRISSNSSNDIENILVKKITVTGENSNIDQIKKGLVIDKITVKNNQPNINLQTKGKDSPKEARLLNDTNTFVTAAALPLYTLVPNSGTSYFYPSAYGGRYTQQNMKWSSINFSTEQTYEHDIFLYNYDRKTYLDGTSTSYPGCYPNATYAATSWPVASQPYLDTRLSENLVSCEVDELAYTIGAAQASALQANVDYYTYIRTANGNDTTDKFKLQGQVGHRTPSNCYTTWCSFGDQSYNIIRAWSTNVPGTQSWIYNGEVPAAPSNVSITNPTTTSLQVNFTDNATDETNILIERKTGTGGSYVSLGGFGALAGTGNWYWVNTGLLSKTTYCYRLKAINAAGSSAYSNEACGTTL